MALFSSLYLPTTINQFPNPNSNPNPIFPLSHCPSPLFFRHRNLRLSAAASLKSNYHKQLDSPLPSGPPESLRQLAAASAVFFLGLGISICSAAAASTHIPAAPVSARPTVVEEQRISGTYLSHIRGLERFLITISATKRARIESRESRVQRYL